MNRTEWLQDRRMKRFKEVFGRWQQRKLPGIDQSSLVQFHRN